uniref:Uncharacterized protein n=1 Tax=Piliocolobus tephrosceles TaxID=591936 RepID=A0A8C9GWR0_9PRIM
MTLLPLSHQRTTGNEGHACLSHLSIWLAGKEGTCMLVKEEVGWKKWGWDDSGIWSKTKLTQGVLQAVMQFNQSAIFFVVVQMILII